MLNRRNLMLGAAAAAVVPTVASASSSREEDPRSWPNNWPTTEHSLLLRLSLPDNKLIGFMFEFKNGSCYLNPGERRYLHFFGGDIIEQLTKQHPQYLFEWSRQWAGTVMCYERQ